MGIDGSCEEFEARSEDSGLWWENGIFELIIACFSCRRYP